MKKNPKHKENPDEKGKSNKVIDESNSSTNSNGYHQGFIKKDPDTLKASLLRIIAHTKKEIKVLTHDKIAMILLILLPITLVLIVQFGAGSSTALGSSKTTESNTGNNSSTSNIGSNIVSRPIIGIVDHDYSTGYNGYNLSEELIKTFQTYQAAGKCILYLDKSQAELDQMLGKGEIDAYIVIENMFEYNLSTHFVAYFDLYLDPFDHLSLPDITNLVSDCVSDFKAKFNFPGAIEEITTTVNVPEKALILYQISPVFFPLTIFSMTTLVVSQSLIGDIPKDRMILTPVNKKEIILGKLFGSIIITSGMVVILWGLSLSFGMSIRSNIFIYLFVLWSLNLVSTAIGLLISAVSKTSLAAFQFFILIFIYQAFLILFIKNKYIITFFPLQAAGQLIMQAVMEGMGLFQVGADFIPYILILYGEFILFTILAYLVYRSKQSLI